MDRLVKFEDQHGDHYEILSKYAEAKDGTPPNEKEAAKYEALLKKHDQLLREYTGYNKCKQKALAVLKGYGLETAASVLKEVL